MIVELNQISRKAENGFDDGLCVTRARAGSSEVTPLTSEAGKVLWETNSRDDAAVRRAGREEKVKSSRHRGGSSETEGKTAECYEGNEGTNQEDPAFLHGYSLRISRK